MKNSIDTLVQQYQILLIDLHNFNTAFNKMIETVKDNDINEIESSIENAMQLLVDIGRSRRSLYYMLKDNKKVYTKQLNRLNFNG